MDKPCSDWFAENESYVIIGLTCLALYVPNDVLSLAPSENSWQYASKGWSSADPTGSWSLADVGGQIDLNVPDTWPGPYALIFDNLAYLNPKHSSQSLDVAVNGTQVVTRPFDLKSRNGKRSATIPRQLVRNDSLHIALEATRAVSPTQLGDSADTRRLGIAVKRII